MTWLRTYYGDGSDAAFLAAGPDPPNLPMFQDAGRYDYGTEWERVLTRMPEMLDPYGWTPEKYAAATKEALEQCVQAEEEERQAVEDEGGDWDEDGLGGWICTQHITTKPRSVLSSLPNRRR